MPPAVGRAYENAAEGNAHACRRLATLCFQRTARGGGGRRGGRRARTRESPRAAALRGSRSASRRCRAAQRERGEGARGGPRAVRAKAEPASRSPATTLPTAQRPVPAALASSALAPPPPPGSSARSVRRPSTAHHPRHRSPPPPSPPPLSSLSLSQSAPFRAPIARGAACAGCDRGRRARAPTRAAAWPRARRAGRDPPDPSDPPSQRAGNEIKLADADGTSQIADRRAEDGATSFSSGARARARSSPSSHAPGRNSLLFVPSAERAFRCAERSQVGYKGDKSRVKKIVKRMRNKKVGSIPRTVVLIKTLFLGVGGGTLAPLLKGA